MWTFTIEDTDVDHTERSDNQYDSVERAKLAAYEMMCSIFDGPVPTSGVVDDTKQYVPLAQWVLYECGTYEWDVYGDKSFIVNVYEEQAK
jgi:hypothetical protein